MMVYMYSSYNICMLLWCIIIIVLAVIAVNLHARCGVCDVRLLAG